MSLAQPKPTPPSSADTQASPGHQDAPNWNLDPQLSGDKDQAKRAFLRLMSHELRTPLNSIIGFAEILSQELYGPLGSPNYVEYAGIIRDSGSKLLNLFNNFIDIVRLEGGSNDYRPSVEPILPIFDEAVAKTRAMATARGVNLDVRAHDENQCASFDPRGLLASLDHLIHNAIDFAAPGDSVVIDAVPIGETGETVEISVFNRGNAPHPDDIERLMRPFEQGSSDHNRIRQGAGLGWAIVRLNASAMGGEFIVQSVEGESLRAILRLKASA